MVDEQGASGEARAPAQTVLLVEDDRMIQRSMVRFLRSLGHAVETADNGRVALERLLAGGIDLCLLDMGLPEIDGMGVLRRYREAVGDAPDQATIVVVSARDDMTSTIEAVRLGAYDYLLKPVDLDRLELTLSRALAQRAANRRLAHYIAQEQESQGEMLGRSEALREVFKSIGAVSATRAAVLIRGESGTGKELVARAIHKASADAAQPFVAVNCSAFATELLESELFGHARGSFTGAVADRMGRFELAGSGTLFLDEIGELSASMQVKLLRVLQDRVFERVGDARPLRLEARVVAATHRDLARMVREGSFREDLYYRLRVVELIVPPLRERKEDIPVLVTGLLPRLNRNLRTAVRFVSREAMELLQQHSWPGNVRELENALTGACVAAKGEMLSIEHLPPLLGASGDGGGPASQGPASRGGAGPASQRGGAPGPTPSGARRGGPVPVMPASAGEGAADEALLPLWEVERNHVARVLVVAAWNKRRACEILQITRPTLDRKIKDFGLEKPATARGDA